MKETMEVKVRTKRSEGFSRSKLRLCYLKSWQDVGQGRSSLVASQYATRLPLAQEPQKLELRAIGAFVCEWH